MFYLMHEEHAASDNVKNKYIALPQTISRNDSIFFLCLVSLIGLIQLELNVLLLFSIECEYIPCLLHHIGNFSFFFASERAIVKYKAKVECNKERVKSLESFC